MTTTDTTKLEYSSLQVHRQNKTRRSFTIHESNKKQWSSDATGFDRRIANVGFCQGTARKQKWQQHSTSCNKKKSPFKVWQTNLGDGCTEHLRKHHRLPIPVFMVSRLSLQFYHRSPPGVQSQCCQFTSFVLLVSSSVLLRRNAGKRRRK